VTDAVPAAATPPASEVESLRKQVRDLEAKLGRTTLKLAKLERDLDHARAQVAWFHRQLFGQKSEHVDAASLERAWKRYVDNQEANARGWVPKGHAEPEPASGLQFLLNLGRAQVSPIVSAKDALAIAGITEESIKPDADAEGAPPDPKPKSKRGGGGRRAMPGTLRVEPLPLEPEGLGEDARRIDVKTSFRIAIRPAEVYAIAVERAVCEINGASDTASGGSTVRVIADTPDEMIDRGLFAPSGLAHIIAQKWDQQVPYYRQSAYFAPHGVDLPKSTLSGVAIRAASKASLLVAAMTMLAQKMVANVSIDATGAPVLAKDRCLRGHTWVQYAAGIGVFISFTEKHNSEVVDELLADWLGKIVGDGAAVYDHVEELRGGERGGCWAHGRRKLVYAMPVDPRAMIGIKLINDLFDLERQWLDELPAVRLAARQQLAAPKVDEIMAWAREINRTEPTIGGRRSMLAKAVCYLIRQERRLRLFLSDGHIPIHNNLAELQLRHFVVGRKNWLFYGSKKGAVAGSIWLTLVLSARMHDLAVEPYLRDLFRVLPSWPRNRIIELAPHAWAKTKARLDPAQLQREFRPLTIPPPSPD